MTVSQVGFSSWSPSLASGPPRCTCSFPGECEATGGNILDVLPDTPTELACSLSCEELKGCEMYSYMGRNNTFR